MVVKARDAALTDLAVMAFSRVVFFSRPPNKASNTISFAVPRRFYVGQAVSWLPWVGEQTSRYLLRYGVTCARRSPDLTSPGAKEE
mmetsp:Transcript_90029/g.159426  ORF Transcript_90029/g.159426 Transcript_90029/m.159426 type:complete len:86 (-) Transcript_90029:374-631(-)